MFGIRREYYKVLQIVMNLNDTIGVPYSRYGVPKYSEKYKDVLNRFYQKNQLPQIDTEQTHKFHRIRLLGLGAHSMVYIVLEEQTKTLYAQKIIKKNTIANNSYLPTQIKIHLHLHHPNIIQLYHCYSLEDSVYLLMELGEQSLFAIKTHKSSKFTTQQTLEILNDILSGLTYMHSIGLVHGDLKLQNLVKSQGKIKICDFGYTHKVYQPISKEMVGTLQYLPPEYAQGIDSGYKRDIWAVGIIAYQLLTGTNPLDNLNQQKKWLKLLEYGKNLNELQKMRQIQGISYKLKRILQNTLCNSQNRASSQQLLSMLQF